MDESETEYMLRKSAFLLGIAWGALSAFKETLMLNRINILPHQEEAYKTLTDGIQQLFYPDTQKDESKCST